MSIICAISTPPGVGGIAVIRVSGYGAIELVDSIWKGKRLTAAESHTAHLGSILDLDRQVLDQAVATIFRSPASFTGEDVVEVSVHGSRYVQQQLINTLIARGARLAEPGEFTRRAYLNGRLDLAQAEAVADVIASESRASHRIAMSQMKGTYSQHLQQLRDKLLELAALLELELDFTEEDVEFASRQQLRALAEEIKAEVQRLSRSFAVGEAIKEGIPVAITGATNAGKSSLLNALVGDDRAIVSDIHGTTRDVIEETITIGDYRFRFQDTAGLRETDDAIERLGIERSHRAAANSAIQIHVVDATDVAHVEIEPDSSDRHHIYLLNKADLFDEVPHKKGFISISTVTGHGLDTLRARLEEIAAENEISADTTVTNARHYQALILADESITRAIAGIDIELSGELIAQDIRETITHLNEILGQITTPDILQTIFSRFCVGK